MCWALRLCFPHQLYGTGGRLIMSLTADSSGIGEGTGDNVRRDPEPCWRQTMGQRHKGAPWLRFCGVWHAYHLQNYEEHNAVHINYKGQKWVLKEKKKFHQWQNFKSWQDHKCDKIQRNNMIFLLTKCLMTFTILFSQLFPSEYFLIASSSDNDSVIFFSIENIERESVFNMVDWNLFIFNC